MAANFWTSSHYKQLLDQEEVDVVHPLDKEKGVTLEDFKLIKMHMANCIPLSYLLLRFSSVSLHLCIWV
ncbi:Cyclin-C1-1 [Vitis vinifera]|uniref:Cyclin-C1-1 n=1 Tax=Vitis vinifera TaxID=29760 RepID=A0A438I7X8_VITVI|nr:Cyclin-C1-1 [Vitis vinifera]